MKASKILISMLLLVALCMSLASFPAMADGPVASVKTAGGETVEKNSLDEALQAAGKGDTVTLLQDVTLNSGITIEKDIILDLGGNVRRCDAGQSEAALRLPRRHHAFHRQVRGGQWPHHRV